MADALRSIALEYAESVRQCEVLRTSDIYPFDKHRAEWDKRLKLQSKLLNAAAAPVIDRREGGGEA